MKKHIYLTGFMGAGKSRIGRVLGKKWAWPFYDSDTAVEQKAGMAIKEIFKIHGEQTFRQMESEAITELSLKPYPSIISLGGGALILNENLLRIQSSGLLIYIKSTPENIFERVKHNNKRPLLQMDTGNGFEESLLSRIRDLLKEREPVYLKADIVFERDGLEPNEVVDKLIGKIECTWENYRENH